MSNTSSRRTAAAARRSALLLASLLTVVLTMGGIPAVAQSPALPPGLLVAATSWSDTESGWVLASADCPHGRCPVLLRTTDSGKSWTLVKAPPVDIGPDQNQLVFASSRYGWVTDGHRVLTTHDGGQSWTPARLPATDAAATSIRKIAATASTAYALVSWGQAGVDSTAVFTTGVTADRWRQVPELTIEGGGGWDIATSRDGGVFVSLGVVHEGTQLWRLADGSWQRLTPVCSIDAAVRLSALSTTHVLALCSSDPFRGEMAKVVVDWVAPGRITVMGEAPQVGISTGFAATTTAMVVGAVGAGASWLHVSTDQGLTFQTPVAWPDCAAPVEGLSFQDATHGVAVVGGPRWHCGRLYRTADAGKSWSVVLGPGRP